tara:strand:+ start:594 stop:755 length:162 start_codon:yes stop_codon:yes gene_type:complete
MIKNMRKKFKYNQKYFVCEKCGKTDDEVDSNYLLFGYKLCKSCKLVETIFPIF